MAESGPSATELTREQTHAEAGFLSRLQTLGGFGGKSDQLNFYQTYLGKPDAADDDLSRYLDATPVSIRDAVATWLKPDQVVALSVVPAGMPELALPDSRPAEGL
jgi:zinc protease